MKKMPKEKITSQTVIAIALQGVSEKKEANEPQINQNQYIKVNDVQSIVSPKFGFEVNEKVGDFCLSDW